MEIRRSYHGKRLMPPKTQTAKTHNYPTDKYQQYWGFFKTTEDGLFIFDTGWTVEAKNLSAYQKSLLTDDFMAGAHATFLNVSDRRFELQIFSRFVFDMIKDMKAE